MQAVQHLVVVAKRFEPDIRRLEQLPELPGVMALGELLGGIIAAQPRPQQRPVHGLTPQEGLMSRQQRFRRLETHFDFSLFIQEPAWARRMQM
jgi:hypothetical protein